MKKSFKPIKGYSGFIAKGGLGMGQLPPAPLGEDFQQDYQQALAIQRENEANFFEYKLQQKISTNEIVEVTKETLEAGHIKFVPEKLISISPEKLIQIDQKGQEANFYLNGRPSSYAEISSTPGKFY